MSGVPNVFGSATSSIPLSQLDVNFNTPLYIGTTSVGLGNTVTSFGNVTLTNTTITVGNVTTDLTVHGLTVGLGNSSVSTNTVVGTNALQANTSGATNTAIGNSALQANTTASNNTAVGYQAGYSNTTGTANIYIGQGAGYTANSSGNIAIGASALNVATGANNTVIGLGAGIGITTGSQNTFVGSGVNGASFGAGSAVTTGYKNTILGSYSGNQGGLDIRTANNYIVLSDGDGNPRGIFDSSGNLLVGQPSAGIANSSSYAFQLDGQGIRNNHGNGTPSGYAYMQFGYNGGSIGSITQSGTTAVLYNTTSDYRLKSNVQPVTTGLSIVSQLNPVNFTWVADNEADTGFLAHEFQAVIPRAVTGAKDAVDVDGNPVYQQMDNSGAIPYLVAAIKELKAEFDAYKATHP